MERIPLAHLATTVAVNLHNALAGKGLDIRPLYDLAEWLSEWLFMKPTGIYQYKTQILLGVWKDKFEGRSINGDKAIEEMKEEVAKIVNHLSLILATSHPLELHPMKKEIELIKIFCIKLSKYLLIES